MSWNSLGPLVALHGKTNSKEYLRILGDHVHPIVYEVFPYGDGVFQDDDA